VKIGVLTDVHANLPALEAGLRLLESQRCDVVVHTGDAIGIGPHPAECLDLLLRCGAELVIGNHDEYFAFGLDDWPYTTEELAHQRWVHDQLDPALRALVAEWPLEINRQIGEHTLLFTHYGRAADGSWAPPGRYTTVFDLDEMFQSSTANVIFFGHDHDALDVVGARHYVNPGSVGCHHQAEVRAAIVEVGGDAGIHICTLSASYDDSSVFADLEGRHVPAREFIRSTFLARY
jgi:putative phosphoesterase